MLFLISTSYSLRVLVQEMTREEQGLRLRLLPPASGTLAARFPAGSLSGSGTRIRSAARGGSARWPGLSGDKNSTAKEFPGSRSLQTPDRPSASLRFRPVLTPSTVPSNYEIHPTETSSPACARQ